MIQNRNKVLAFNDGICNVYSAEHKTLKANLGTFPFKEYSIGIKTRYQLGLIGESIDKVIAIPFNPLNKTARVVGIVGDNGEEEFYTIKDFQPVNTFPKSYKLNLYKGKLEWKKND